MSLSRPFASVLVLILAGAARAESPPDPLRLVPDAADFTVEVKRPSRLLSAVRSLDVARTIQALPQVREALDSTNARRLNQLIAHFERTLGAPLPELLDRLADGGAVLAGKFGDKAPALLVVQGRDPALTRKFFEAGQEVLEQELARQESKERPEKRTYRDCEVVNVGKDFHAAVAGAALLVSNKAEALKLALDLHHDGPAKSLLTSAKRAGADTSLPADPLARLWASLEPAHKSPQGKEIYASPRNDPNLTVLFGGLLDVVGRSPFVSAGLYREENGFLLTARLPSGRDGSGPDFALHVPPADGAGVLPPLEPKGVLFSTSFYLDLAKLWEDRAKLLSAQNAKNLEETDQKSAPFLVGNRFSQLLTRSGPRHRFVAVNQTKTAYKTQPRQNIPAFAFVMELRQPEEFARSMEAILRGAALLGGNQFKTKLAEEKHGGHAVVGYRFQEGVALKQDPDNLRYNFSPCFVRVGNQMAFCSTLELCREIVDLLNQEAKSPPAKAGAAAVRTKVYGAGGAEALRLAEDQVVSQLVLDQAVTIPEAREQTRTLIDLVRRLGVLNFETVYEAKRLRYDVRLTLGK